MSGSPLAQALASLWFALCVFGCTKAEGADPAAVTSAGGAATGGAGGSGNATASGGMATSGGTAGSSGSAAGAAGTGGNVASGGDGGAGGTSSLPPVCATAAENESLTLTCPADHLIESVVFASYGNPTGTCTDLAAGDCNASDSVAVVEALCLGRPSCTVTATNAAFGDPCNGTTKSLSVAVTCGAGGGNANGAPFKGVANSPCAARTALNVSWYYNWTQGESEPCTDGSGGDFVPMIWGHPGDEQDAQGIANDVASFVSGGYEYVLGFNEPDNSGQANILVDDAIGLWPSFDVAGIQVGSPATSANAAGQAWFTDFTTQLNADTDLRADFLAIHWYGWNAGSCDAGATQLESYISWVENIAGNRPIWITEWGCLNQSAPDVQTVVDFYNGALAAFARHPRVERYAWYPWATNCGLVNDDGSLTALGEAYSAAPAYR